MSTETATQIAALNDALRERGEGGTITVTYGVRQLGEAFVAAALEAVRRYSNFTPDNDPYGEHDFGSIEMEGRMLFWKIDYHDKYESLGSLEPEDPTITRRVLTIMLVAEY